MSERYIFHVDMDAFFTSVEVMDNPALYGKPVIVGGGTVRGVVAAASYEARQYGVYSAMPMVTAIRKCPQAIVLQGRMQRYCEVSHRIMELLGSYTPLLEQVSVDEAYLDLSNWIPAGTLIVEVANEIQQHMLKNIGLSCSIGVASGKAIAKIASDLQKPLGLVIVPVGEEASFLAPLAIDKLRGVGEATERKLRAMGIATIGDLARFPERMIVKRLGVAGRYLLRLAQGHDESPIVSVRQAKSIGRETTFLVDIQQKADIERSLLALADDVAKSLRRHALFARGLTLKVRYNDFTTFTRSCVLNEPADVTGVLFEKALDLFRTANVHRPLRLLGVTATALLPSTDRQLSLFSDPPSCKDQRLAIALDTVRARFGDSSLIRARLAPQVQAESEVSEDVGN